MGICHIIGAGETSPHDIKQLCNITSDDLLIAADGGYDILCHYNLVPDVIIGDFDSCNQSPFSNKNIEIIELPPEKDFTDMHTCVNYGLEKGYCNFFLYGGSGGRIDHTFANIQLLHFLAKNNCTAAMFGTDNIFNIIHNGNITFAAEKCGYISIFSLSDISHGVNIRGLKYQLDNYTLTNDFSLGVSNEFIGTESHISVSNGTLLIISPR